MEGGKLAVGGASANMKSLAYRVEHAGTKYEDIDEIVVTMDAHQGYHISHPLFWVGTDATTNEPIQPKPFTPITYADVKSGVWRTSNPEHQKLAEDYLRRLEKTNRHQHMIWPEHCIMGSVGQTVYAPLHETLCAWEKERPGRAVKYVLKGTDARTEMYSALSGEVPTPNTAFNEALYKYLNQFDDIEVAGEAASHCVNWSVRDLVARDPNIATKMIILPGMMSPVEGFEKEMEKFYADMTAAGASFNYNYKHIE